MITMWREIIYCNQPITYQKNTFPISIPLCFELFEYEGWATTPASAMSYILHQFRHRLGIPVGKPVVQTYMKIGQIWHNSGPFQLCNCIFRG